MKTIGLLFDVSGSMKNTFDNMNDINDINKKSNELIDILKNICKNVKAEVFSILYGANENPFIFDFIKLLKLSNNKFKPLTTTDESNQSNTIFREKLIDLLSKDDQGNPRFCDIREYVLSNEYGIPEKLSEFFCNILEDNRPLIDIIYNKLPIEVTNEEENRRLNRNINVGRVGGTTMGISIAVSIVTVISIFCPPVAFASIPLMVGAGLGGNRIANNSINNSKREETIKAIKSSFKECIENITGNIIDEYKKNFENYEILKVEDLLNLIESLEEKIIKPDNKDVSIVDLFEKYIYGNTPLYKGCMKAFELFDKNLNNEKILFIVGDGLLNDVNDINKAKDEIILKSNELNITIVSIYLNDSEGKNKKTFYNEIQPYFDRGAKFLFEISSKLSYHNNIIRFFIKKNWNIPLNGTCNLFVEINNSNDLNQFINLFNESLGQDPIEEINKIIGDSILDTIIETNYINQFESVKQVGSRCWAYALSAVIYLASSRVFGRKIKKFKDILDKLLEEEKALQDSINKQGRKVFKIADKYLKDYKLRGKTISNNEARNAVMKGRPCLCRFDLNKKKWHNFSEFFENNPKGILTNQIINKPVNNINSTAGGHAVVLVEIEENCLKFLNSWGKDFGDNGYFRIENENVLDNIEFMDIFWYESDLSQEEINKYNNNYLYFIQQATNYLSNKHINLKDELKKEVQCEKCGQILNLDNFDLILYQSHFENDDNDIRKLKVKCLKCNREFISDSLTTLLYIKKIIN